MLQLLASGSPAPGLRSRREYDVELEHKLEVAYHWQDARTLYSSRLWPVVEEAGPPPRRSRAHGLACTADTRAKCWRPGAAHARTP